MSRLWPSKTSSALAFLQTGADEIACVEARVTPARCPRAGSPAFFAPDFALGLHRPCWFDVGDQAVRSFSLADWRAHFPIEATRAVAPAWSGADEARFAEGFRSLTIHLDRGTLRKGVPITRMTARVPPIDAAAVFARAVARVPDLPPGLIAYGFYMPAADGGAAGPEFLIGATPEMLFQIDGGQHLLTMAVAGTLPTEAGPARLEASPKNRDEHDSVVEDILAQLAGWGRARASPTEVRAFGQLEHLVTDIRLEADVALDFESVARRLHPTPALGVYPRSAAGAEWLAGIDPAGERGRFGAPFGLRWPSGDGRCLVAIRGLQYRDGRLDIWAGGGVVPQSRYDDEWQEVLQKIHAVRTLWDV